MSVLATDLFIILHTSGVSKCQNEPGIRAHYVYPVTLNALIYCPRQHFRSASDTCSMFMENVAHIKQHFYRPNIYSRLKNGEHRDRGYHTEIIT